ncbi:hypothetical protein ACFQ8W_01760 [Streptomyces sp. NPDC056508]|uniref:hypothetical protein n=1 Tax=Streptomyces sp. NPDC056508 TaxID=3345845 RepID=UPI00369EBE13
MLNEQGAISAKGPISNVSVHAHMRSGPHSLMENPLDLVVVTELSFLLAEQARRDPNDPPLIVTPLNVLAQLRELGVQSVNGKPIGRDAVYQSFARLRAKGYIRQIVLVDEKTKQRTGVAYEFYDWPAWNPECPNLSASAQVEATSGIAGSGNAGSEAFPQVGATSGNAGNPPHPPEEVTTSSPYPLTDTTGHTPAPPEEEGRSFTPEQTTAASQLLQVLPQPWSLGRVKAKNLAPKLLESMTEQGWPELLGINDRDRALLVQQLTKNPGRMNNPGSILERDRIPNLPLYEVVAASVTPSGATSDGKCPTHPKYRAGRHCIPCAMA